MMAQTINSRYVVAVRDLEASTKYYVDVLGFRKDPIDAAGWSFLTRDAVRLMLGESSDAQPAGELGDHSYFAYWNLEGIDDFYHELVSKGALVTSPPTNKPWGLREFGLRTPDGHRIVCGQVI
jgi:catechol 2,3-dioxygenase-like lactoylglutathione lyase family enzyme